MKTTVPVPAAQEALVDAFVQTPVTVHVSDPNAMYEAVDDTLTLPVTIPLPEAEVIAPPLRVTFPFTVRAFVPFASEPEGIVSDAMVSGDAWVRVPVIVTAAKVLPAETFRDLVAPVNVTLDDVAVNPAAATEEVFHEPATDSVALPKLITADAPDDVRSELKMTEADVRVSVPLNVIAEATVVEIPGFTVRL